MGICGAAGLVLWGAYLRLGPMERNVGCCDVALRCVTKLEIGLVNLEDECGSFPFVIQEDPDFLVEKVVDGLGCCQ